MRSPKWPLIIVGVGLLLWVLGEAAPHWLWHPLGYCTGTPAQVQDCKGYNSWSGSFSDVGEVTLIIGLISGAFTIRRFMHEHFECHEETCHKIGVHHVAGTPHRACWVHHPILGKHEKGVVPLRIIHGRHAGMTEHEIEREERHDRDRGRG